MTDKPEVRVEIAGVRFHSGDVVSGAFVLPGGPPAGTGSVELSVLWHTTGKGTEDLGVIHYRNWSADDDTLADLPNPGTFSARLPNTPWSYDGTLVKIHWAARVRLRYGKTSEVLAEAPFVVTPRGRP